MSETDNIPEETAAIGAQGTEEPSKESLLEKELEEAKDRYLRLLAESENTRKRMQKEKQEMIRFSAENVIAEFLLPMDNLENALRFAEHASQETANWAKGFHMILEQFKDVLGNHGVTPFVSKGELFDPHLHEAVETEFTDTVKDGFILEEYVKGYKSRERVIRPSRVKVAKKPAAEPAPEKQAEINQEKE